MPNYITESDITDLLLASHVSEEPYYLTRVDNEINSLAEELEVLTANIADPLHYKVKEYAIAYCCFIISQDKFGSNMQVLGEQGLVIDPYSAKLSHYQKIMNNKRLSITPEILANTADLRSEHAVGVTLERG